MRTYRPDHVADMNRKGLWRHILFAKPCKPGMLDKIVGDFQGVPLDVASAIC
jgi:hypothetical protein